MTEMKHFIYTALLMFVLPFIISCGKDENVELDNYIIGKWHSYKGLAYYPDGTVTISISKTGEGSGSYFEIEFNKDGTAIVSGWKESSNGSSVWVSQQGYYNINGNEVILTERDQSVTHFIFENKSMYFRGTFKDNLYGVVPFYIYYKK